MSPLIKYNELRETDFFIFFNLHETEKRAISKELTEIRLKPGGFQEHIDIMIVVNKDNEIVQAILYLHREWIGNVDSINPFAKDISKSFIASLVIDEEFEEFKNLLVQDLWALKGRKNNIMYLNKIKHNFASISPLVKQFIDVYYGINERAEIEFGNNKITMENKNENNRNRFIITLKYF